MKATRPRPLKKAITLLSFAIELFICYQKLLRRVELGGPEAIRFGLGGRLRPLEAAFSYGKTTRGREKLFKQKIIFFTQLRYS